MLKMAKGMRVFTAIWAGELVAVVGTGLASFGLSVWTYQQTESVTLFAMIMLCAVVPGLLVAPFAGVMVDRLDRRHVMLAGNGTSATAMLVLAAIAWSGNLELWHIYAATVVNSLAQAFQRPAFTATITLLVPREHLGRASGMTQMGMAIGQIVAPAVAGTVLVVFGVHVLLAINVSAFLFSLCVLAIVRIPRPAPSGVAPQSVLREAALGWTYLSERSGLLALLGVIAVVNLNMGFAYAVLTPLVLTITTPEVLGVVSSLAGVGMLLGTLAVSAWGGPKRRMHGVLVGSTVMGLAYATAGLRPSVVLIGGAIFVAFAVLPLVNASSQVIFHVKTPAPLQGRVFAMRMMVGSASMPLAFLIAGPLADRVLEPLMAPGGGLAAVFGPIVGTGAGRGMALLLVLVGLPAALLSAACYLVPRIHRLEDEIPDAPPAATADAAAEIEIEIEKIVGDGARVPAQS